jgi:hypothetical protein
MKVRELIQDLLLADPDAEVLIATDSGYSPPTEDPYTEETADETFSARTVTPGTKAIVLWPQDLR